MDTPASLPGLLQRGVYQRSPVEAKIALFRSLFRGREDVYPRRFENRKTGKIGYSPECGNEWVRGICEKPRIKCSECHHQRFLPVTDEVIRWHLSGQDNDGRPFVMGVYPMLLDETFLFLAADFDKAAWQDDAAAFLETCRLMSFPVAWEGLASAWLASYSTEKNIVRTHYPTQLNGLLTMFHDVPFSA